MIRLFVLVLTCINFIAPSIQLFPGAEPDEGDYRHLYPPICAGIYTHANYSHGLRYIFGMFESLRYPRDRLHLAFYVDSQTAEEVYEVYESDPSAASNLIHQWLEAVSGLYKSTSLIMLEKGENWRESVMKFARKRTCSYALLSNSNSILLENSLRQLIDAGEPIVAPLLNGPFGQGSNHDGIMREDFIERKQIGSYRVYYSYEPLLIHLGHRDASYLTFDQENLVDYRGSGHPVDTFAFSAYSMNIPIMATNAHYYGYYVGPRPHLSSDQFGAIWATSMANLISESGSLPVLNSVVKDLRPASSALTKFGFDEIYLINLRRRPERLRKMAKIFQVLGIAHKRFEAIDGESLEDAREFSQIRFLPNYLDPYHKRPMKRGEIGCFLSHYTIWQDMVANSHDRAIIFEDDLRFTENSTIILRGIVEDLMKTQLEWDLIYLGRKKMSSDEFFLPGHQYLSTVGYSYWTLGYALTRQGAQKLLQARPLKKLLALDEFLPIMYDKHPNNEWKSHFEARDLKAFAAYPVIVEPERYTFDTGYVSDTEDSHLAEGVLPNATTLSEESTGLLETSDSGQLENFEESDIKLRDEF